LNIGGDERIPRMEWRKIMMLQEIDIIGDIRICSRILFSYIRFASFWTLVIEGKGPF